MSDTPRAVKASTVPTEWAVGAIVLGSFALLLALRSGFGPLIPKIGG